MPEPGRHAVDEWVARVVTDENLGVIPMPRLDQWNRATTKRDSLTQVFVEHEWVPPDRGSSESMHGGKGTFRTVIPTFELALSTFMPEDIGDKGAGPGSKGRAEARRRLQTAYERLEMRLQDESAWERAKTGIIDVRDIRLVRDGERDEGPWPRLEYRFRFEVLIDIEVN